MIRRYPRKKTMGKWAVPINRLHDRSPLIGMRL